MSKIAVPVRLGEVDYGGLQIILDADGFPVLSCLPVHAAQIIEMLNCRNAAEKAIADHNAECVRLCDDRKRCGWDGYRSYMKCPECPKDWIIE